MICPICGKEMTKGGIILTGKRLFGEFTWYPQDEFDKKGLKALDRSNGKNIDSMEMSLMREEKFNNAYLCESCNKIVGIFTINTSIVINKNGGY
ncbi:MAG: PF20097 family protein [Aminipila sp.]